MLGQIKFCTVELGLKVAKLALAMSRVKSPNDTWQYVGNPAEATPRRFGYGNTRVEGHARAAQSLAALRGEPLLVLRRNLMGGRPPHRSRLPLVCLAE